MNKKLKVTWLYRPWLWKAIARDWNSVCHGLVWVIGNGAFVPLWEDAWCVGGEILVNWVIEPLPNSLRDRPIAKFFFLSSFGQWNWDVFEPLLTDFVHGCR